MEKFICFVSDADDACMYPLRNLRGLAVTADATILMTFNSFRNSTDGTADRDTVTLTTTSDKEKVVMEAIAQAINGGPHSDGFIVLADDVAGTSVHADLLSVAINYAS
jgi:hypothetical protein